MPAILAESGMPYWMDLSTTQPRAAIKFYKALLGWQVNTQVPGFRQATKDGLPVAGIVDLPLSDGQEPAGRDEKAQWQLLFCSDDVQRDYAKALELGATGLTEPTDVGQRGTMALFVDPAGAKVGLLQPVGEAFFGAGEPGVPVWFELTANRNYTEVIDFYHELFEWTIATMSQTDEFTYSTAMHMGAPFAGLWKADGAGVDQDEAAETQSFWAVYLGVENLDQAVAQVPELGGTVVREPWDSEFGRMCIVTDPTGALVTLTEVEPFVETEPIRESDSVFGAEFM
ncbi:VOC family protein [Corynebacterium ulceribovis]|uniref:VOC family protein n=1 Tax=Corynebacterium ulceribovis TaxID=487732 RepID=UPI00037448D0|nr:VOC family protein [Corynebacterium ulceribovis]